MTTREQLDQLWVRAGEIYKKKRSIKYACAYRVSAEESVSSGDCSGATKHFTVTYVLTDSRYLDAVKQVRGFQRSMKHIGTYFNSSAVERIDINGTPSVDVYLDPTSACERVCCAMFLPFCIPLVAYQCCMAEEIEKNAIQALIHLISQGEQWVTDTLTNAESVLREQQRFNVPPPLMVYTQQQPRAERGGASGYSPAKFSSQGVVARTEMIAGARTAAATSSAEEEALFLDVMRKLPPDERSALLLNYVDREILSPRSTRDAHST